MSKSIHHGEMFKATPKRIYQVLTDAKQFGKMTGGAPTEISSDAGGQFSCFGGMRWCQTEDWCRHGGSRIGSLVFTRWSSSS